MKTTAVIPVVAVMVAAGIIIALKQKNHPPTPPVAALQSGVPLPRLVDLGAGKCIPCKMMAPILEELKKEYAGRFNVEFIDTSLIPGASQMYGITVIPTQIFYDAAGKERRRHEGFMSKEDILALWKELGIDVKKTPAAAQTP